MRPSRFSVVDLAHAELSSELVDATYRARFEQTVRDRLGPSLLGYDIVALCQWRAWGAETQFHFLAEEEGVDPMLAHALFGGQLAP